MRIVFSSPWIPIEWIKAHGHEPQGIWSTPPDATPALPEGMCAFARGMMTAASSYQDAAFVFTTACDQMRRAADALTDRGRPRTFLFNLPSTWQSKAARALYHGEFARLGGFLQRGGGRSPSDDQLREVIRQSDEQRKVLLHVLAQRSSRAAAEAVARHYSRDSSRRRPLSAGTLQASDTRPTSEVESVPDPTARSNAPSAAVPLGLVGGPLSATQWSLFDTIESCGGQVALNATEPGERTLPPPLGEDFPRGEARTALADHYFDHIVDVFQRPNSKLYSWLGPRLSARRVRGILLWVHVGCDLWRAEAESLREAFSLPLLVLESHDLQGIASREAHRLQAFVESLR